MSSDWLRRSLNLNDSDLQVGNFTGRRFVFTWNNPEKEMDTSKFDKNHVRYMIYQVEIGESGTTHYQGYIECTQNKTWKSLSKVMGSNRIHWELAKGTQEQCIHYCSKPVENCECEHCRDSLDLGQVSNPKEWGKAGINGRPKGERPKPGQKGESADRRKEVRWMIDRVQEGWTNADFINEDPLLWFDQRGDIRLANEAVSELRWDLHRTTLRDQAMEKLETLNPLQKLILKHLREQDDRQITFVVDRKGGSGKTVMCEILEHIYGYQGFHNARTADIAQSVKEEGPKSGYVIDLARSLQRTQDGTDLKDDFVNYQVIENLKDGRLFASKWNSSMKRFVRPKVLVLMNFHPTESRLSEDRWDIINWNGCPKMETSNDVPKGQLIIPQYLSDPAKAGSEHIPEEEPEYDDIRFDQVLTPEEEEELEFENKYVDTYLVRKMSH